VIVLISLGVLGYLLGSIPFGLVLTRLAGLGDIRKIGSGNIGATNVLRTGRKGLAAATLLADVAKGAASVLLDKSASVTEWANETLYDELGQPVFSLMPPALHSIPQGCRSSCHRTIRRPGPGRPSG